MDTAEAYDVINARIKEEEKQINENLQEIEEILSGMDSVSERRPFDTSSDREQLSQVQQRLNEKELVIAFMGITSAGKSTSINVEKILSIKNKQAKWYFSLHITRKSNFKTAESYVQKCKNKFFT